MADPPASWQEGVNSWLTQRDAYTANPTPEAWAALNQQWLDMGTAYVTGGKYPGTGDYPPITEEEEEEENPGKTPGKTPGKGKIPDTVPEDFEPLTDAYGEESMGGFKIPRPNGETLNPVSKGSTLPDVLPAELEPHRELIEQASKITGVPATLIAAVIWDESKGNQKAGTVNGGNGGADTGVMQVNSETYKGLATKYPDLLPATNDNSAATTIMAGTLYLKDQYETFGNWPLALRAYNSGPSAVDPSDYRISKPKTGTKNYVEKVMFFENEFIAGNGDAYTGEKGYPKPNELYT